MLHLVTGPVDAETLLREARWAVETFKLAQLECRNNDALLKVFFRKAHAERLLYEHRYDIRANARRELRPALARQGRVHRLLAISPLPRLEQVYKHVFETLLDEKVSSAPVKESP